MSSSTFHHGAAAESRDPTEGPPEFPPSPPRTAQGPDDDFSYRHRLKLPSGSEFVIADISLKPLSITWGEVRETRGYVTLAIDCEEQALTFARARIDHKLRQAGFLICTNPDWRLLGIDATSDLLLIRANRRKDESSLGLVTDLSSFFGAWSRECHTGGQKIVAERRVTAEPLSASEVTRKFIDLAEAVFNFNNEPAVRSAWVSDLSSRFETLLAVEEEISLENEEPAPFGPKELAGKSSEELADHFLLVTMQHFAIQELPTEYSALRNESIGFFDYYKPELLSNQGKGKKLERS